MQTVEMRQKTLGRLQGKVMKGRQIARTLGFPTANILVESVPEAYRMGVYGVVAGHRGKRFMKFAGTSPDGLCLSQTVRRCIR